MPGESCTDQQLPNAVSHFRVEFYYVIYDTCIQQMRTRFEDFMSVAHKFFVLHPKNLSADGATETLRSLALTYKNDVDVEQTLAEYSVYKSLYHDFLEGIDDSPATLEELSEFLVATSLDKAFPNITTLVKIGVTIPVSTAGVERSFSHLKLIKSYLRSTIGQDRLSNLALLSIERRVALSLDFDEVITSFF